MRYLNMKTIRLLTVCLLLAPLGVQAMPPYAASGPIGSLTEKKIRVNDILLRLSPTVKVMLPGNKQGTLASLTVGDNVGVKMLKYQGKAYVDYIYYLPRGAALANELPPNE